MRRILVGQCQFDWESYPPLIIRAERLRLRPLVVAINEQGKRIGESHHNSTISDALVDRIRNLHEYYGVGYLALAAEFQISKNTIRKICTYERRAQTPVRWKRLRVPVSVQ